jgi:hypothetical protein
VHGFSASARAKISRLPVNNRCVTESDARDRCPSHAGGAERRRRRSAHARKRILNKQENPARSPARAWLSSFNFTNKLICTGASTTYILVGLTRISKSRTSKAPTSSRRARTRRAGRWPLQDDLTGAALVAAMQASPYREIDLEPNRSRSSVRDVRL